MAVFTLPCPSVPGLAIPGDFTPGNPGAISSTITIYTYTGPFPVYYLQYLGPEGTLYAVPGQTFTSDQIFVASGWSYPLAVPPQDGHWTTTGNQTEILYAVVLGKEHPDHPVNVMARGKVLSAELQAELASRPVAQSVLLVPELPVKEEVPPTEASVMTAQARALNAELQARRRN